MTNKNASSRIRRSHTNTSPRDTTFERAKNIATIFSAIAIPIVLTIAGYFIQRQIADESLKKDYVAIASSILKESPKNQEPDLRTWAITVLDKNSPVPFSKEAKSSLLSAPIVVPGPAWLGPPATCRTPPKKRHVFEDYKKLSDDMKRLDGEQAIGKMVDFVESVIAQEKDAMTTSIMLECMQKWADTEQSADIDYRRSIGAPSSKSVYEQLDNRLNPPTLPPQQ
jgi:hypothetical protein